jgi:hypothetical protein
MPVEWLEKECPKISQLVETTKLRTKISPVQKWHFD